jgi:hypothetical protein
MVSKLGLSVAMELVHVSRTVIRVPIRVGLFELHGDEVDHGDGEDGFVARRTRPEHTLIDSLVAGDDRKRQRKPSSAMTRRQRLHVHDARTRWSEEGGVGILVRAPSSGTSSCTASGNGVVFLTAVSHASSHRKLCSEFLYVRFRLRSRTQKNFHGSLLCLFLLDVIL